MEEEVNLVLSILLSLRGRHDKRVWMLLENVKYTMKTTYRVMVEPYIIL